MNFPRSFSGKEDCFPDKENDFTARAERKREKERPQQAQEQRLSIYLCKETSIGGRKKVSIRRNEKEGKRSALCGLRIP